MDDERWIVILLLGSVLIFALGSYLDNQNELELKKLEIRKVELVDSLKTDTL